MNSIHLSDIHLLHPRTPSPFIIDNIANIFLENKDLLESADAMFIGGDVTDGGITTRDLRILDVVEYYDRTFRVCEEYNLILRLMDGTISHDREQGVLALAVAARYPTVDFKYIKTPTVETIRGETVLFIPDNWGTTSEELAELVNATISDAGYSTVDMAILHGMLDERVPEHFNIPAYSSKHLHMKISGIISIGHDHRYGVYDRVVIQGSVDRLCHNEEEDKGMVYHEGHSGEITRMINYGSKIYKSIDVSNIKTLEALKPFLAPLVPESHIRLVGKPSDPLIDDLATVRANFPNYYFTVT